MNKEKPFLVPAIIIIALLLISMPYIYAYSLGGSDFVFSGFLVNPLDGNSYLAKMYEGWRGDWQFTLPYTPEKGEGSFLFLFYIFLGHVSRVLNVDRIMVYHVSRVVSALILFYSIYRYLSRSDAVVLKQKWVYPLFVFGSGMGWLFFLFGVVTSDFWVAEAYPFLSAYTNPHFCLGLAFVIWIFTPLGNDDAWRAQEKGKKFWSQWYFLLISLALSIISPFGVIIVILVMSILLFWYGIPFVIERWKHDIHTADDRENSTELSWLFSRLLFVVIGGVPLLVYYYWVSHNDPLLSVWNSQNITNSPPFWDLLISFSPLIILTIPVFLYFRLFKTYSERLFIIWFVLSIFLLYFPIGLQRRFMMGLFVPVAGLSVVGLNYLMRKRSFARKKTLIIVFLFLFALPTNLLVILAGIQGAKTFNSMIFLTTDEVNALNWLEDNVSPDALVLASPEMSLFIPAWTGRRVLYAHPYETAFADVEKSAQTAFFRDGVYEFDSEEEKIIIDNHSVDYVVYGLRESVFGPLPEDLKLDVVYRSGDVEILTYPKQ